MLEKTMRMELGNACREARHVLSKAEVDELAKEGKLSEWDTLQKQVAPWYFWSEMFYVPFLDGVRENAARELRRKYREDEQFRREAAERFAAKQR